MSQCDEKRIEFLNSVKELDVDAVKLAIKNKSINLLDLSPDDDLARDCLAIAMRADCAELASIILPYVNHFRDSKPLDQERREEMEQWYLLCALLDGAANVIAVLPMDTPAVNKCRNPAKCMYFHVNPGVDWPHEARSRTEIYYAIFDRKTELVRALLLRKEISVQNDCFVGPGKLFFALDQCLDNEKDRVSFLCRMGRKELERALKFERPHSLEKYRAPLLKAYIQMRQDDDGEYLSKSVSESLFQTPRAKKIIAAKQLLGEVDGAAPWHMTHFGFLGLVNTRTMSQHTPALGAGR